MLKMRKLPMLLFIGLTFGLSIENQAQNWTWQKGSNSTNDAGIYGSQQIPNSVNNPSARYGAMQWVTPNGNLWLFGGFENALSQRKNDLWRYAAGTDEWTWMKGDTIVDVNGTYGTQGTPALSNQPGSRNHGVTWVDTNGDLWLFGGRGFGESGSAGWLNDLWRYDVSTNQWTWIKGSKQPNQSGSYGTQGVFASGNVPSTRSRSTSWIINDSLYLFGGDANAYKNDMWVFDISLGQWAWVDGSNGNNQSGTYPANLGQAGTPGGRIDMMAWTDQSGEFWMYGGNGRNGTGNLGLLSDLWRFDLVNTEWIWEGGTNTVNEPADYGNRSIPVSSNLPGGRAQGATWTDDRGNLWLYGGYGFAASGGPGKLGDMWRYELSSGLWTWTKGDNSTNTDPIYGTLTVPDTSSTPGSRGEASFWFSEKKLWLFGGEDRQFNRRNDLWNIFPAVPIQDICLVTVNDISTTNIIVWEKNVSNVIDSFRVYRQNASSTYLPIITVSNLDTSYVEDPDGFIINPNARSYRYKMSAIDDNGTESPLSPFHETVNLSVVAGTQGEYVLSWDNYEGFPFVRYYITRSVNSSPYFILDSVNATVTQYQDFNPPIGSIDYRIEVLPPSPCVADKNVLGRNFNRSTSNSFAAPPLGLKNDINNYFKIYPNPVEDLLYVRNIKESNIRSIKLINGLGHTLIFEEINYPLTEHSLNLRELPQGWYVLQIETKDQMFTKTIIR